MAKRNPSPKSESQEEDDIHTSSDIESMPVGLSASEIKKMGEFGKILINSAVKELRCEFQKFAIDAVEMALCGDNAHDLQEQLEKREDELEKLHNRLQRLQNDVRKQKGNNSELKKQIKDIEKEIEAKELQLRQLRRRLQKLQKEHDSDQQLHDEKVKAMQAEIDDLKAKYNKVKGQLQVKASSENIARDKLPELRQQIEDLEDQLKKERMKKK
ncbi:homer protein homolog 2-like isoform X3 [Mytilus californianus]|uniref:homer protein homolog 2-like isoform X3 n=1 Tax=Mytilus californianus TaxID=6549 RepID=UPI0022464468|nr:homer protein homolog 2-like isoform X3 [Mytilus californianus]